MDHQQLHFVEEHEEPKPPELPCAFQLAKFSELYKLADTEKLLNVQGVVIHVFPPKEQALNSTTRDIVIINEKCNTNQEDVKQLIDQIAYKDSNRLLPVPEEEEDIIRIEQALETLRNVKTAWIRSKPKLTVGQQRFWYTACMKCQKSIHANIEWTTTCPPCKEDTQVEAWGRIAIVIDDGTGSINAVILGMDAKKLIPYIGCELKEADGQEISLATEFAASIENHATLCFVLHYDIETQAGLRDTRYNVVKAYIAEEFMDILPATTNKDPVEVLPQVTVSSKPIVTQQPSSLETQTKAHFAAEPSPSKRRRHHTSN